MNAILEKKLNEIKQLDKDSFWYIVKQTTSFREMCYLVSFLKEYQEMGEPKIDFENYLKSRSKDTQERGITVTETHRALKVAEYYGLIRNNTNYRRPNYDQYTITPIFDEVKKKCGGNFELTDKYSDIIERQIEKVYLSSPFDTTAEGNSRREFSLYPVMLLYKVLLELGRAEGDIVNSCKIDMNEYKLFILTARRYTDYTSIVSAIQYLRAEVNRQEIIDELQKVFENTTDSRFIHCIEQLTSTITTDNKLIALANGCHEKIAKKLFEFEKNINRHITADFKEYCEFLCSKENLVDTVTTRREEPLNIIYYGVPGVGKSHTVMSEIGNNEERMERVVFHPDYTYADFVGQLLPQRKDGKVEYNFVAGPFTRLLKKAVEENNDKDNDNLYYLVIEEINRGNAAAIFGDVFQLLDRSKSGESKFGITNVDMAKAIYGEEKGDQKVKIPSNVKIIATMNTSDQNVFTLDTAFQRRWAMRMIPNDFDDPDYKFGDKQIADTEVCWKDFAKVVNGWILQLNGNNMLSSEDKRLGRYFVTESELEDKEKFAEKVIKYLWDDAFKLSRKDIFNEADKNGLEYMIKEFKKAKGFDSLGIFNRKNEFHKMPSKDNETIETSTE